MCERLSPWRRFPVRPPKPAAQDDAPPPPPRPRLVASVEMFDGEFPDDVDWTQRGVSTCVY